MKSTKRYKIHYMYRPNKKMPTPKLMFTGEWLRELGFEIGGMVTVKSSKGKLILTLEKNDGN